MKYKPITWGEFIEEVEKQGVKKDSILRYIDIDFPLYEDDEDSFSIKVKEDGHICISKS